MTVICWTVFTLAVLSPFLTISRIGKQRTPIGRDDAAIAVITGGMLVAVCLRALRIL